MSNLTAAEKRYLEEILDMGGGYVLDFSNATFEKLFAGHGIDIYGDEKYSKNGESKAKRLRAFWEQDTDAEVARILDELLDLYEANCNVNGLEVNVKAGRTTGIAETTSSAYGSRSNRRKVARSWKGFGSGGAFICDYSLWKCIRSGLAWRGFK